MLLDILISYHTIKETSCQAAHFRPALKADVKNEIKGLNAETS